MTNFIKDNSALAAAKSDNRTDPSVPATQKIAAADWNEHRQALLDIQSYLRGDASSNRFGGTSFRWRDDWMVGQQLAQGNGWNGITIGTPPYALFLSGANSNISPVTGHQRVGLVTLSAGTTAAGQAAVATQANLILAARGNASFEAVVGVQTLSTGANEYAVEIGLKGNAAVGGAPDGYGCTFIYDRANVLAQHGGVNPTNQHKWICAVYEGASGPVLKTAVLLDGTTQGGVATVNSPIAAAIVPDTNFFRLRVDATGTTVVFRINDVIVATITTNIPTHSLAGSVGVVNSASAALIAPLYLDYTELGYDVLAPRIP